MGFPSQSAARTWREVDRLNEQAWELERTLPASMLEVAYQAHALARELDYQAGIARSLAQIGKAYVRLGDLDEADRFLTEAMTFENLEPTLRVEIYNSRGVYYLYTKTYDKAFTVYYSGLQIAKNLSDKTSEAWLLNNIGEIYRELRDFPTALDYYHDSIKAQATVPNLLGKGVPVGNLSAVYIELGDLERAALHAQEALVIAREQEDLMVESVSLHYLGIVAKRRGQYEQAIRFLDKSLAIYRNTRENIHACEVLVSFYKLHFQLGENEQALDYLNEALVLATEADSLALRRDIFAELVSYYEVTGDYKQALFYFGQVSKTMQAIAEEQREQRLRAIGMQLTAEESLREKEAYRLLNEELAQTARELREAFRAGQAISAIGKSITATFSLERIFALVHEHIEALMPAQSFGIGLYNRETDSIKYYYLYENGKSLSGLSIPLSNDSSLEVACFKQQRGFLVNSLSDDVSALVPRIVSAYGPPMAATIFQPLVVDGESIGIITVQNGEEQAYNEKNLQTLEMLSSYVSIAIQNAQKSAALQEEIRRRELVQSELQQLNAELASLSNRDGLTNVANRRHFNELLQQAWSMGQRQQQPISLLMVDVDLLKDYNDYFGHLSGDDVIKRIANALKASVKRGSDLVARYGGDEFVVLLVGTDETGAHYVAREIQANVAACNIKMPEIMDRSVLSVSIGVATMVPSAEVRSNELIVRSDLALYQAKQAGRNKVCVYRSADERADNEFPSVDR